MPRRELADHASTCPSNFEDCPICKEAVRVGQMSTHRQQKAELHVQLLEAKLLEKESDTIEDALVDIRKRLTDVESAVKKTFSYLVLPQW